MCMLSLQIQFLLVGQLIHVLHGMRALGHQGALANGIIVLHQIEFGAKVINVFHQLLSGDAPQRVLEYCTELVAGHIQ